jgi:hypothetical protein
MDTNEMATLLSEAFLYRSWWVKESICLFFQYLKTAAEALPSYVVDASEFMTCEKADEILKLVSNTFFQISWPTPPSQSIDNIHNIM